MDLAANYGGTFLDFVPNAFVEMHCLGIGMIALYGQRDIVSDFQPYYTNGTEQSMDYGPVLAIAGLVPSLVPFHQYCKDYCPDNEHEHGLVCILRFSVPPLPFLSSHQINLISIQFHSCIDL